MSRKYGALVLAGFLGAIMLSSTAYGQPQGGPGGRRGPGMGGMFGFRGGMGAMGVFGLLRNEKVQTDLNLTDDQKTKLDDTGREFMESMRDNFASLQDLSQEERRTKMEQINKETQEKLDKKLAEILEPKQVERLDQIQIQIQGPMALTTDKVSKALSLTDDQKEKINAVRDDVQGKMRDLMSGMRDLSPEERQEKMAEVREKMQQLTKETGDEMLKVLTQDQQAQFEKMKGEKIDINPMDLMPRGPRGRGGPGGPPPQ